MVERTEVDDASFSSVVRSLQLRNIHNMPAHARGSHKTPLSERRIQRLSINSRLLFLLPQPMGSSHPSTIKCPVQIRVHNLVVMVHFPQNRRTLCPWYARVRNEDVQPTVEIADIGFDGGGYSLDGGHVDLVCFACGDLPSIMRSNDMSISHLDLILPSLRPWMYSR